MGSTSLISKSVKTEDIIPQIISLSDKWKRIITERIKIGLPEDNYFSLKFLNRGRSDISKWNIKIRIIVEPGEYLEANYNTSQDLGEFSITSKLSQTIPPDGELAIPISQINYFPKSEISWII